MRPMSYKAVKYIESRRFSKSLLLAVIDRKAEGIAKAHRFDRSNGTSQLIAKEASEPECSRILRAVEYGRMKALEEMGESISEGFRFDE